VDMLLSHYWSFFSDLSEWSRKEREINLRDSSRKITGTENQKTAPHSSAFKG